jgi:lysophospholipase L1-like esterase
MAARPERVGLLVVAPMLLLGCGADHDENDSTTPYASWAASPQDYAEALPFPDAPPATPDGLTNQSIRHILRLSAGGDELRVRLSNLFGSGPITIDRAGVALSQGGPAIDPASHVPLTFGGSPRVTLAAGQEIWSDFAPFDVEPETDAAVTFHVAGSAPFATVHSLGQQTAYIADGDAVAAATLPTDDTRQSYYWLSGVDMASSVDRRVIVAFGDSITDGYNSTPDTNQRYPNVLSARMTEVTDQGPYSVVNAGISGNRVLNDVLGPSGVSRFERDVLGQSGVSDVVILLGINDIGFSGFVPAQDVSAEAITGGLSELVSLANADGVRVFLATLLPFGGAMPPYYSEAGEAKRQAVNDWIRANTDVAGVIDFDRVMADSQNPLVLLPAYDSSDGLHPNDTGYAVMAGAIPTSLFE